MFFESLTEKSLYRKLNGSLAELRLLAWACLGPDTSLRECDDGTAVLLMQSPPEADPDLLQLHTSPPTPLSTAQQVWVLSGLCTFAYAVLSVIERGVFPPACPGELTFAH